MWFRVSFLCLALAAGCAGRRDDAALVSYLESEPAGLDPAFAVDVPSGRLCALLYDGLVGPGEGGRPEGRLAENWEVSADGTRYTFHLREAFFSDGTPVTSRDVAYSIERLLSPDVGSPRGWVAAAISGAASFALGETRSLDGLSTPDERTLVVRLSRPFAPFISMLAMPCAGVVPAGWAGAARAGDWRSPVCSGPWKVGEWKEGQRIVLVRNERHRKRAPLERVVFRVLPERMTQVAEFEVGNLDHLSVPRAEIARWENSPEWKPYVEKQVELAVTYIGLNCQKPPFEDPRVRRALNYALDVEALVDGVMKGAAVPARGAIPPGLRGYDPGRKAYGYDPERARELLSEAGLREGLEMEIWYRDGGGAEEVLEAVQAYLARVGVSARLVAREWGTLKEAMNKGIPDAYYLDWYADYQDPENFLFPLFHSSNWGGGGNRARFSDPVVDSLLEAAAAELDPDERYEMYRRIDGVVYESAPWIYLWHPVRVEVRQPWLRGRILHPLFYGARYLDVVKEGG